MMCELLILVLFFVCLFLRTGTRAQKILHFLNLKGFCLVVLLFSEGSWGGEVAGLLISRICGFPRWRQNLTI